MKKRVVFIIFLIVIYNFALNSADFSKRQKKDSDANNKIVNINNTDFNKIIEASKKIKQASELYFSAEREKNMDKIISLLEEGGKQNQNNYLYWQLMGEIFQNKDLIPDAIYYYNKSLELFEDNTRVKAKLAELYMRLRNNKKAKELAEEVYNEEGVNIEWKDISNMQNLAFTSYVLGDIENSEKYAKESIINWEDKKNPYEMVEYAKIMTRIRKFNEAETAFKKAEESAHNNSIIENYGGLSKFMDYFSYEKAYFYYKKGDKNNSLDLIEKLLEKLPDRGLYLSLKRDIEKM